MPSRNRATPRSILLWFSVILIIIGVILGIVGFALISSNVTGIIGVISFAVGLFLLLIASLVMRNK